MLPEKIRYTRKIRSRYISSKSEFFLFQQVPGSSHKSQNLTEKNSIMSSASTSEGQQEANNNNNGFSIVKVFRENSWIIPPAVFLIIGSQVNFKTANLIAFGAAWLLLAYFYFYRQDGEVWPKTFDVINPIAYTVLLPVVILAGEDFSRLWMGVIILGIFMTVTLLSVPFGRPLMTDWIPKDKEEDEREAVVMHDLRVSLTYMLGGIFVIMFVSNLVIAIRDEDFGTIYVIFNFVIPYGSLAIGIRLMHKLGPYFYEKSAERHFGENWKEILFPEPTEHDVETEQDVENQSEVAKSDDPN